MTATKATATGTLAQTPLAHLLVYMLDKQLSGTVVVEDAARNKNAVLVAQGAPTKAKTADPVAPLGELLVQQGALKASERDAALGRARAEGKLLGESLVACGAVDSSAVTDALIEQLARRLEWLAGLSGGIYGFYDAQDFLGTFAGRGVAADPLALIWRVVRQNADRARVESTVNKLEGRQLRFDVNARVARFGFSTKEQSVVDVLRAKPHTLAQLVAIGLLPEAELKKLVYVLTITRHLDLGIEGSHPVGVAASAARIRPPEPRDPRKTDPLAREQRRRTNPKPAAEPAAPQNSRPPGSPEEAEFREQVDSLEEAIGKKNYYEILGVEADAPSAQIQAAFFQLAKRWHPDKLPANLHDLRDTVARIFSKMSEAHQVLMNDEQRAEYEQLLKEGGATADEQEQVQQVLRAAAAFQKAEVLVRKGNLVEAEKQALKAHEGDPEQAEYAALYADILARKPERAKEGYADAIRLVDEAKRLQPENVKVRLYRARVLKRAGEQAGAMREFRYVVEREPGNVEAAREVRLYEMRKKAPSDKATRQDKGRALNQDIGSLFGKLFKK